MDIGYNENVVKNVSPSQPDCMYNINKNNLENVINSNNNFVINISNYFFGGSVLKIKL